MKELEGEINGFGYKPKMESWKDETNEVLKVRKEPYRVINNNSYIFLQIFTILFFIGFLVIGGFLTYMASQGKFQDIVSNNNTCPDLKCPDLTCPSNNCNPVVYSNSTLNIDSNLLNKLCNQTI